MTRRGCLASSGSQKPCAGAATIEEPVPGDGSAAGVDETKVRPTDQADRGRLDRKSGSEHVLGPHRRAPRLAGGEEPGAGRSPPCRDYGRRSGNLGRPVLRRDVAARSTHLS